jgi:rhamnosyltransferase
MSAHDREICAVVVTFHPDSGVPDRLDTLSRQVAHVIVVDNGSTACEPALGRISQNPHIEVLRNSRNEGVAAAFNTGVSRAIALGFHLVLMLDQDSAPRPGMVDALVRTYELHPDRERIAVLASQPEDAVFGFQPRFLRERRGFLFERALCEGDWLDDVSIVISSGSVVNTSIYQALGGFREDFFIDYVDTEYCLRALTRGYRIVVACGAKLEHRLGDRTVKRAGPFVLYPTRHSPTRWYYISRNRIPMLRMYARRFPHWLTYEISISVFWLLRMLVAEDRRAEKVGAVLRGTWDGLRGRMGPMPGSIED